MLGYDLWTLVLGLGAGLACGFLNTAASSGSAVSLPLLILVGLDPTSANATNRIPVLIGGISASLSFHAKKVLPWSLAAKVAVPATLGSLIGAGLAERLPSRQLGLVITGAVLVALVLLFSKLKQAIEQASADTQRYGWREAAMFFGIGVWLGFIVLDGATYLLLALTLAVGLSLVPANAIKSAVLVPTTLVAMVVFAYKGNIDWTIGAIMGVGSVAGAWLGARFATSPNAKKHVFYLLVIVISAELVNLSWHYLFRTHGG
jgi:uncharacterized membrane protein YfcA